MSLSPVENENENEARKSRENEETIRETRELFEIPNDNGFIFCDKHVVPEVLAIILSYVSSEELVFNCRRVCKGWCNVIDSLVWRIKLNKINVPVKKIIGLPWFACYWLEKKRPFNRNLIKNNCGEEGFNHWNVHKSGGDGWKIEKPPLGCYAFTLTDNLSYYNEEVIRHNSCFATSYGPCKMSQTVDLNQEGLCPELMNSLQPTITVTEWCTGRNDCASVYTLQVILLDWEKNRLKKISFKRRLGTQKNCHWQMASRIIKNYGPGVRYIKFVHIGNSVKIWRGHYGSKMTGANVTISF